VVGSYECGIKPLGFIKGREFLDQFSDNQLFKKNSTEGITAEAAGMGPWSVCY
jgi:hypothetical protein